MQTIAYPGMRTRRTRFFAVPRYSMTYSSGTSTLKIESSMFWVVMRCSRFAFTLRSWPE